MNKKQKEAKRMKKHLQQREQRELNLVLKQLLPRFESYYRDPWSWGRSSKSPEYIEAKKNAITILRAKTTQPLATFLVHPHPLMRALAQYKALVLSGEQSKALTVLDSASIQFEKQQKEDTTWSFSL